MRQSLKPPFSLTPEEWAEMIMTELEIETARYPEEEN